MALPRIALLTGLACAGIMAACGPKKDPSNPNDVPRLPSPLGQIYTRAPGTPDDPVVAKAAAGLPWDEVLSGAAAGLALDSIHGTRLDPYLIRWRGILAAYPYPITGFAAKQVPYDEVPEELLKNVKAQIKSGTDIGLVRARSHEGDLWVLLVSEHFSEIGPIPRDPAVGERITLLGAQFTLVDPVGALYNPKSGGQFVLSMPGEWLVEVTEHSQRVALFPLFVGVQPHLEPPILPLKEKPADLGAGAIQLLNQARSWGGLESLKLDTGLASVARARLRTLMAGEVLPEPESSLKAAGFGESAMTGAHCQAKTLTDCIDGLWWSVEHRKLFSEEFLWVGAAVEGEEGKDVRIMLMLAG